MPSKTEEVTNLKTMPKGLSASLPDLDSEAWIEVKKRPRPSPIRPKVTNELHWRPDFLQDLMTDIVDRYRRQTQKSVMTIGVKPAGIPLPFFTLQKTEDFQEINITL